MAPRVGAERRRQQQEARPVTNVHRPIWADNSSRDPVANRAFYAGLFGWTLQVNDDPQYGGYAIAQLDGRDAAGFGGQQDPNMPASLWNLYIATPDAAATVAAASAAGGRAIVPPFAIGAMGTSAFIADPVGAVFGLWQPAGMTGFGIQGTNAFGWGELNGRNIASAVPFYETTFGWTHRTSDMGGGRSYTEFLDGDESLLGAFEMPPQMPADVPNAWMVYFAVDDVAAVHDAAVAAGGTSIMAATPFPGGTFAVLADPLGGTFGLISLAG
jgi:predicted enzyme related to lactoylglutathione lyase